MSPCTCAICRMARAMKEFEGALDELIESGTDQEMHHYHLRDQVHAATTDAWWRWPMHRPRLRRLIEREAA